MSGRASGGSTLAVTICRWWGVPLRVHLSFFVIAAITLLYAANYDWFGAGRVWSVMAAVGLLAILAASLLGHELGHWVAARRLGGRWPSLVIGLPGGLGEFEPPAWRLRRAAVYLAGPLVHGVLVVTGTALLMLSGHWKWKVLDPLAPAFLVEGPAWVATLKSTVWINWLLLWFNVLPGLSSDGSRALAESLLSVPRVTQYTVDRWIRITSRLMAVGFLAAAAWAGPEWHPYGVMALIGLGFLGLLASVHVAADAEPGAVQRTVSPVVARAVVNVGPEPAVGPPSSSSAASAMVPTPRPASSDTVVDCEASATTMRLRAAQRRERMELVDEFLERISREGIDSLSPEELEWLRRISRHP
ncbi:MAG: hypothetical protein KatS3mg110_2550 [Pirellulaceae bacterium]|nr:MAG: hypothetical protein KatS3mg110_2550 [Pirellulaceae bacterium]